MAKKQKGQSETTIILNPEDRKRVNALKKKLQLSASAIYRLALLRLAQVEGVE